MDTSTKYSHALLNVFVLMVGLLLQFLGADSAAAQAYVGKGGLSCQCSLHVERNEGDAEERCPPDIDSTGDSGSDYRVKEVSPDFIPDPMENELSVRTEAWLKTPQEILDINLARLSPIQRELYEFMAQNDPYILALRLCHGNVNGVSGPYWHNYNPRGWFFAVQAGPKTCFFQDGWYKGEIGIWAYNRGGTPRACDPFQDPNKWYAKAAFCVSRGWLGGDPQRQLDEFGDEDSSTFLMDYFVGLTPFLGTFDLAWNQGALSDAFLKGDCSAAASLLGSAASDLAIFANVLKVVSPISRTAKIFQAGSYVSGCGSVGFTGGYLIYKGWTGDLDGYDYGRAALLGIEVIGLILDRQSRDIIKEFVEIRFFKAKKPSASCLACGPICGKPNESVAKPQPAQDTMPLIKELATCSDNLTCPAPPNLEVLDGITALEIDQLIAELPETLIRRENRAYMNVPTNAAGKPRSNFSDGGLNPADSGGDVKPIDHIGGNPEGYAFRSPWLSFADPRLAPDGIARFGDARLTFRVRDFLNDLKNSLKCGKSIILTFRQLNEYLEQLLRQKLRALGIVDEGKISAIIAELRSLATRYPIAPSDYERLNQLLDSLNISKTRLRELRRFLDAYRHQLANSEVLVHGSIPSEYITID